MNATTTLKKPVKIAFPKAAVEQCLRDELIGEVSREAGVKGVALPSTPSAIVKMSIHIDSLVTVDILCSVEPIIGFELPQHVVRTGGYSSIEMALSHLMPRIEKQWNKKHGVA